MTLGLVALPVLIGVVIAVAVFVMFGPAIADLAKNVYEQVKETISEIKDTWRSE